MYTVFAEGIEVVKKAGVYTEESLVENIFKVDIKLIFDKQPEKIPDYEVLCDMVIANAHKGFTWIEEWADKIYKELSQHYAGSRAQIRIKKINPAFAAKFVDAVGIEFEKEL
ncbi:MAG: dihydroneopterin aldolase [Bacteroidia bacterium]|nr:dihydroneopterin aldolase [Bacteroidia bacterium]MCO5254809.1 dihydroneopterin aldolase [Bacteroidota bacterium]MCZ2130901.1 dihydroneopterin aldolase [Bacteroidia bacterium]